MRLFYDVRYYILAMLLGRIFFYSAYNYKHFKKEYHQNFLVS